MSTFKENFRAEELNHLKEAGGPSFRSDRIMHTGFQEAFRVVEVNCSVLATMSFLRLCRKQSSHLRAWFASQKQREIVDSWI